MGIAVGELHFSVGLKRDGELWAKLETTLGIVFQRQRRSLVSHTAEQEGVGILQPEESRMPVWSVGMLAFQ